MPKYVIGYDLNDTVSQITYSQLNTRLMQTMYTVNSDNAEERLGVPSVLCKRSGVNQWYYGDDANEVSRRGEGTLVGKLISFAKAGAKLEIEGEAYDPVDLIILFIKRSLNVIDPRITPDDVAKLVFTVDVLDERMISILNKACSALAVDKKVIEFQSYDESIYYYTIHQPEEVWDHEVCVYDYSYDYLKFYNMRLNKHTTPVVGVVDKTEHTNIKLPQFMMNGEISEEKSQRLDELFLQTVHDDFAGHVIGTVFLIGDGFSNTWCDKTLKYLCMGRRVFQGKNLYSKGACFAAADRVSDTFLNDKYIYLGHDKLKGNTGMKMRVKGKDQYVVLADAGETYYTSKVDVEFILEKGNEVAILVTPLNGSGARNEIIELTGLPLRPERATRLRLEADFKSDVDMLVKVYDLGFGEFHQSSGKIWEKEIKLT